MCFFYVYFDDWTCRYQQVRIVSCYNMKFIVFPFCAAKIIHKLRNFLTMCLSIYLYVFYRIVNNNYIGVIYTPLERAQYHFTWAVLVHVVFLNNSCNFLLYVLTAATFREQLVALFTRKKPSAERIWGGQLRGNQCHIYPTRKHEHFQHFSYIINSPVKMQENSKCIHEIIRRLSFFSLDHSWVLIIQIGFNEIIMYVFLIQ